MTSKPIVLVVDGLIAAGKSTLISKCLGPTLRDRGYSVIEILEPVDEWKKSGMLQRYYSDPQKYAFQFQTHVFHTRVRACQKATHSAKKSDSTPHFYLLERSVFTDRIFMLMLLESGIVEQSEYDIYMDLWDMRKENMPFDIDAFIYLKPTIDEAMRRMEVRKRPEETGVSKEYQEALLRKHDEFLNGNTISGLHNDEHDSSLDDIKGKPVLHLDTDVDFVNDSEVKEQIVDGLLTFLRNANLLA